MPTVTDVRFSTADGFPLAGTLFAPDTGTTARASVLVNSAMAVPRAYYASYAKFLASEGFRGRSADTRSGRGDQSSLPL